jgi:hypothetical protein
MATTLQQILDYYADKLIAQYRLMPRARATIEIFGKQIIADNLAEALGLAFSIDTAVGPQLDVLGKYIGVNRNVGDIIPDDQTYFAMTNYAGAASLCGFGDYTDSFVNPNGLFYLYQYAAGIPSALSDEQYRLILKLQIVANSSDGTLYSLQNALATFLGGVFEIVDPKDMTLVYVLTAFPPISLTVLRRFLPRPMTLDASLVVTSPTQRCIDDGVTLRKTDTSALRAIIAG